MFVAYHFDPHSTTYHPTSPSSDPLPCSLSPTGSALDGLGFAHSQQSRQLAWPNRVHLRCGLGVSHSVAPDHASRHRPYSVLLVLSRFNNAGLSPALISASWRTGTGVLARQNAKTAWKLAKVQYYAFGVLSADEDVHATIEDARVGVKIG